MVIIQQAAGSSWWVDCELTGWCHLLIWRQGEFSATHLLLSQQKDTANYLRATGQGNYQSLFLFGPCIKLLLRKVVISHSCLSTVRNAGFAQKL